jgi:exo-1,4-beta-D-glucosaminidase
MPMTRRGFLAAVGSTAAVVASASVLRAETGATTAAAASSEPLAGKWKMQSSAVATGAGEQLSKAGADTTGWYAVTVPCTVLAGLVASGEYPDIYHGENLKGVPKARFKPSWWYRKEFAVNPSGSQQTWLYFKGINYRANIFVNGRKVADAKTAVGAYRDFEVNVTGALKSGMNALAVEVFGPEKNDLSITFVDWAPAPPDGNMGLWQDVEMKTTGAVRLRYPFVEVALDVGGRDVASPLDGTSGKGAVVLGGAEVTPCVDVLNGTNEPVTVELTAQWENVILKATASLAANESKTVTFPTQHVDKPRIWWPWQLSEQQVLDGQEMYDLHLTANVDGRVSDQLATRFGIRKVTSRLENGQLLFTVNGKDLLILGGGYAPDLLQRRGMADHPGWQEAHIRYVRDMNLNTVRLEGKLEDDAFYELCDKYGVLVMAGWCCCSEWERWKGWKDEQTAVAMASARYQIRRARQHPSMLAFLNGSDNAPPPAIEKQYLAIGAELKWPCPTISSAADKKAASGPSGVKMNGPYKWEPPIYWLTDKKNGGAWGFNTEVGPGAVPPPEESIEAMLPKADWWPMDDVWDYHAGGGTFGKFEDFTKALEARFGKSTGLADFTWKAQAQAYETIRAMYEGFRRNKFNSGGTATGEIQWMLNNAWPSMIWHLYDYYFRPGGAYFATKLGCAPLHVLYSYDNRSIVVANDTLQAHEGMQVTADVYDLEGTLKHSQTGTVNAPANMSTAAFTLAGVPGISTTYFLRLTLRESPTANPVSINSYFLSTVPDVLDTHADNKDDWAFMPCSSYADYTALEKLPKVKLTATGGTGDSQSMNPFLGVKVTNGSDAVAMMVRLKLVKKDGSEILPIQWQDNYFMLLPRESREVLAHYSVDDAGTLEPEVVVECFNNNRA